MLKYDKIKLRINCPSIVNEMQKKASKKENYKTLKYFGGIIYVIRSLKKKFWRLRINYYRTDKCFIARKIWKKDFIVIGLRLNSMDLVQIDCLGNGYFYNVLILCWSYTSVKIFK